MNNYDILFDAENGVATIKYHEVAFYRTLLNSIKGFLELKIPECTRLVVDFNEVKFLFAGYRQLINYRHGLKTLLPKKTLSRIAIIHSPEPSWSKPLCASSPLLETDFAEISMCCFPAGHNKQAYQWIR